MHETTPSPARQRTGVHALVWVLLTVLLVACSSFVSRPKQGWNPSYGPVVPHDTFPADCALCHVGKNWNSIRPDFAFDHETKTGVALNGAHKDVACLLCHNDRGKAGAFAAQGCAGCHTDPHSGNLGRMCSECHNERTWQPVEMISRHNRTRFPLVAAHAATACFECHPGAQVGNFAGAPTDCVDCHQSDLSRATSPDHAALGLTSGCQRCHTPIGWKPARFTHPASFPLSAGHAGRACSECHKGGVYTGLSTDCASCHMANYQATTNPNHAASGFSTTCTQCHTTATWLGATFNHPATFPLTGGHAGRACAECHKGGVYTGLSTDCASCHMANYTATTNPSHTAAGFNTTCSQCHTTTTWLGATFNHPFPITSGPHAVSCTQCHLNPASYAQFTCTNCHTQTQTNSNHSGVSGYVWASPNCYQCHPQGRG